MQTLLDEYDTTKVKIRDSRQDLVSKIDSVNTYCLINL